MFGAASVLLVRVSAVEAEASLKLLGGEGVVGVGSAFHVGQVVCVT